MPNFDYLNANFYEESSSLRSDRNLGNSFFSDQKYGKKSIFGAPLGESLFFRLLRNRSDFWVPHIIWDGVHE